MLLRTQIALAIMGAVMLTAIDLALVAYPRLDSATVLRGAIALGGILIVAFAFAHILARPLKATTASVHGFALDGAMEPPPASSKDFSAFSGIERRAAHPPHKSEALTEACVPQRITEEKFRLAVESCPSGMLMVDRLGHIVLANGEVERLFGYGRDELLGQSIDILVPEGMRAQHRAHRDNYSRQPETRHVRDLFGRHKDGTEVPVEIGLNPIKTREGPLVLCVIVDISERKRLERLKDDFVATVSHELRTPMTSIAASLGILAGATHIDLPDTAKRLITIANANSARLVRLINDILDLEKIESGKITFDIKSVDLRALIEQTIEANKALADACRVRLRLQDSPTCNVYADPDRLTQVITNLLSNAIKFSPPEEDVSVEIENRNERIRTVVRDHGPGIPEAFKPRVFEKFAQADASNARQKGGTGLGLNIVKQIMQRLGGDVGFADAPGGGTAFYFDLRRADSSANSGAVVVPLRGGTISHEERQPA
jgi:PAS domain S-box-containing protein